MAVAPEWWDVEVLPSARTELAALPEPVREEALDIIEELQENPLPPDAEKLRSYRDRYKIRFFRGRYRILFDVMERQRRVKVTRIRIRGPETYSGMDRW